MCPSARSLISVLAALIAVPNARADDRDTDDGGALIATGATFTAVAAATGLVGTGFWLASARCPGSGDCGAAMSFFGGTFSLVGLSAAIVGLPMLAVGSAKRRAWRARRRASPTLTLDPQDLRPAERSAVDVDAPPRAPGSAMRGAGIALMVISAGTAISAASLYGASYQRDAELRYVWKDEGAAGLATAAVSLATAAIGIPLLVLGQRARSRVAVAPSIGPTGAALQVSGSF